MEVSIVVGTFGERKWIELAEGRAIPSAKQFGVPVIHEHGDTLAKARNAGLQRVKTEFVIHLDADDELDENYVEAMAEGTADMRGPARQTLYLGQNYGPVQMPKVWSHTHDCTGACLRHGNWLVIGTCLRTELALSVGGWEEFGWSEDYALFARCWSAGGTVEAIPKAIYRAHASRQGRNRIPTHARLSWHRKIEKAVWPHEPSVLS